MGVKRIWSWWDGLMKNLLVMSKLTKHSDDTDKGSEGPPNEHTNLISNGVENAGGDGDNRCRGQWLCYANPGTEMLEQKVSIEALDGESEIVSEFHDIHRN
uniref:Uncharacterized protein n=1 Tax=Ananas comosus var. bracteatus TaxID=296719 RepID=A0A6V7Q6K6_ANACO|nr:unnamed protein product [Ananas comosus var. bracteatus]